MEIKGLVSDVDGVLVLNDNFWMTLCKEADIMYTRAELLEKFYNEEIGYRTLNQTVIPIWKEKGITLERIKEVAQEVNITEGAKETISELMEKYEGRVGLLSDGLDFMVNRVKKDLGIKYAICNELEIYDGNYTGKVIYNLSSKGQGLKKICKEMDLSTKEVCVIGDNKNDIPMFKLSGLSIAFNPAIEEVKAHADYTLCNCTDFRDVKKYLLDAIS